MESSRGLAGAASAADEDRESNCLAEVRSSLARSYPVVDVREVIRIAESHGLDRLPDALMVEGDVSDRSSDGLAARLRQISDPARARSRDPHVLFSSQYYDFVAPTVRSAGIAPWLHYQVFGRDEGRSPHSLLDVDFLSQSMPTVRRENVVDGYLSDRALWFLLPSPYVSIERFLLSGEWTGARHPLIEVLTSAPHWIQSRLMVVDSAWGPVARARATAVGYLLTLPGSELAGPAAAWSIHPVLAHSAEGANAFTVIPGYFVGTADSRGVALSSDALSPDGSAIRLESEVVAIARGPSLEVDSLRILASGMDATDLRGVIDGVSGPTAIAPQSLAQERAAASIVKHQPSNPGVRVLKWGAQSTISARNVVFEEVLPGHVPSWNGGALDATERIAFAVSSGSAVNAEVTAQLVLGATLCVLSDGDAEPWLPALNRAAIVVAHASLIDAILPFVERSKLRLLPNSGRSK